MSDEKPLTATGILLKELDQVRIEVTIAVGHHKYGYSMPASEVKDELMKHAIQKIASKFAADTLADRQMLAEIEKMNSVNKPFSE